MQVCTYTWDAGNPHSYSYTVASVKCVYFGKSSRSDPLMYNGHFALKIEFIEPRGDSGMSNNSCGM